MSIDLGRVKTFLLDIEGTTTPIDFVYRVLFPYARAHARRFLQDHWSDVDVQADLARLRREHAAERLQHREDPPPWNDLTSEAALDSAVEYVGWLMDRDRKSIGLKGLQGRIWEIGYTSGELKGQVYEDVPPAFGRWRQRGCTIGIFSSGSVLAQKLLFAHTTAGDLTGVIDAYFDPTIGPKAAGDSYQRIAAALERPGADILFVSDSSAELDAARSGGLQTALCVRPGSRAPAAPGHAVIHTFQEL